MVGRLVASLAVLALIHAPSALGAIAGTGNFTIDTEGDLSFEGQVVFADQIRNVFGDVVWNNVLRTPTVPSKPLRWQRRLSGPHHVSVALAAHDWLR